MAPAPDFSSSSRYAVSIFRAFALILFILIWFTANANAATSGNAIVTGFVSVTNANILITQLGISPTQPTIGSLVTITQNVINDGKAVATNMILYLQATGPSTTNFNQAIPSLSPGQSEVVQISVGGFTVSGGTYTLTALVNYSGATTFNQISNIPSLTYTVSGGGGGEGGGGGGGAPPVAAVLPPTNIGQVSFPEMPVFMTILNTNTTYTQMAVENNGQSYVWVNLTASHTPYGVLSFSTTSLYIPPQQTVLINVIYRTYPQPPQTTFIAAFNVTVTAQNSRPITSQALLGIRIKNVTPTSPITLRTTTLENASTRVLTQLQVYNPTNRTLYDSIVSTQVPFAVTSSINQFILSGGVNNVSTMNNQYILTWKIPVLQAKNSVFLYYSVNNVTEPQYFVEPTTTIIVPSPMANPVKIYDINIPTFYANQSGKISISSIYVGTNATDVKFDLAGPPSVNILDPEIVYKAVPNTGMSPTFNISGIAATGTYILQLTIRAAGRNQSYQLPIVVLSPQQYQSTATTTVAAQPYRVPSGNYLYLALAIVVIAILWAAAEIWSRRRRAKFNNERAEKLVRIREQMKRSGESDE